MTMAPSPAPAPVLSSASGGNSVARLLSVLRELREEFVRLGSCVNAYTAADGSAERANRRATLERIFNREAAGITGLFDRAHQILDRNDELANTHSDALDRMRNGWDDLRDVWPQPNGDLRDAELAKMIRQLVLEIGYVTVPPRANENLKTMRPGSVMNFKNEFEDEIPSSEDRNKILSWINEHPLTLSGIADVQHEKIMAASSSALRRAVSWMLLASVVGLMLVASAFTHGWLDRLGLPSVPTKATDTDYLLAIAAAYVGAIGHVLIAAIKQRQRATSTGKDNTFTALGNAALWVHVNESYLIVYAIAIPVAAYAVMLIAGSVSLLTPFLVGYSIDSVLEILLSRFDKFVGRTELLPPTK
jgi:hypothetical protein